MRPMAASLMPAFSGKSRFGLRLKPRLAESRLRIEMRYFLVMLQCQMVEEYRGWRARKPSHESVRLLRLACAHDYRDACVPWPPGMGIRCYQKL